MKKTPYIAKVYLLLAAFLLALPTIGTKYYPGQEGRFLIASESIRMEPFREGVVYISRHTVFGAFGFIINKPIDLQKLEETGVEIPANVEKLMLGGPVEFPDKVFSIYANHPMEPIEEYEEDYDLSLAEVIKRVERYPEKEIYLGYSGWGPLQLDIEIMRGSWTVIEVPKDIIFKNEESFTLWRDLKNKRTPDRYLDQKI